MRLFLTLLSVMVLLSSCARMPYEQWSSRLNNAEATLKGQKLEANIIAGPDLRLFNGVMNVTTKSSAEPYPRLTSLVNEVSEVKNNLEQDSDSALQKLELFKTKLGTNSISTIGPEFSDYQTVLSDLSMQAEMNRESLRSLLKKDQLFDSLCNAYKIKAVPMVKEALDLEETKNAIEERFLAASNGYDALKRGITQQEDQKESMIKLNNMKQKVRQLESELLEYSNLYSQLASVRENAMLYEGPYINSMSDVNHISEKSNRITGFLNELEMMIEEY